MRVLVAIDESRFSDLALESVKLRVWDADSEVLLCSIVPEASGFKYLTESQQEVADLAERQQLQVVKAHLTRKSQELKESFPANKILTEVRVGPVGSSILDIANEFQADLIVLGSHCRHGIARFAFGSTVESVVTAAPCSVEIIRISRSGGESEGAERALTLTSPVPLSLIQKKFLLCYDGSVNAKAAINWAAQAQWMTNQEFVVLTALAPTLDDKLDVKHKRANAEGRAKVLQEAESELESVIAPLRQNPELKMVQAHVCEGLAAETILQFAEKWGADLIILGAHAAARNDDKDLGSVARKIASEANCSVRIIRARSGMTPVQRSRVGQRVTEPV